MKAGDADDKACGQILRYMGWVTHELTGGRRVRGIIVAHDVSEPLQYAVGALPDVSLRRCAVRFTFGEVPRRDAS